MGRKQAHNAAANDASHLAAVDRQAQALDLRRAGASLRDIGRALGVDHTTAKKYLDKAMADLQAAQNEKAEATRAVELDRLERLHMALWPIATGKDTEPDTRNKTIDRLIRISERRSKLLGLDAPVKQELTGKDGEPIKQRIEVVYVDADRND